MFNLQSSPINFLDLILTYWQANVSKQNYQCLPTITATRISYQNKQSFKENTAIISKSASVVNFIGLWYIVRQACYFTITTNFLLQDKKNICIFCFKFSFPSLQHVSSCITIQMKVSLKITRLAWKCDGNWKMLIKSSTILKNPFEITSFFQLL